MDVSFEILNNLQVQEVLNADGDLKIKFGDGAVKTIVTDT